MTIRIYNITAEFTLVTPNINSFKLVLRSHGGSHLVIQTTVELNSMVSVSFWYRMRYERRKAMAALISALTLTFTVKIRYVKG